MAIRDTRLSTASFRLARGLGLSLGLALAVAALALASPGAARELVDPHEDVPPVCGEAFVGPAESASGPLTVTFHGVSTLMFSDDRNRLLIDGFFTRPSLRQLALSRLSSHSPSVEAGLGADPRPVRAVLVAHAHHDHAMDVGTVAALQTRAIVAGTASVRRLALGLDVAPERLCLAGEAPAVFGPFKVWAYEVEHGPSPWWLRRILDRPLTHDFGEPAWFGAYKDDSNLSFVIEHDGTRILIHPSAGVRDLGVAEADVVFVGLAGVAGLGDDARPYFDGLIGPDTHTIVPIHWDRFTSRPGAPLQQLPWFVDNIGEGLRRLCAFAADAPARPDVVWMEARATLVLSRPPRLDDPDRACPQPVE